MNANHKLNERQKIAFLSFGTPFSLSVHQRNTDDARCSYAFYSFSFNEPRLNGKHFVFSALSRLQFLSGSSSMWRWLFRFAFLCRSCWTNGNDTRRYRVTVRSLECDGSIWKSNKLLGFSDIYFDEATEINLRSIAITVCLCSLPVSVGRCVCVRVGPCLRAVAKAMATNEPSNPNCR